MLPEWRREGEALTVLGCALLGCISSKDGHSREAVRGVLIAEGMALKWPCGVAVFDGWIGDDTRVSMFIVGPLVGDSSRSSREDNLIIGVPWGPDYEAKLSDCNFVRARFVAQRTQCGGNSIACVY